MTKRIGLFIGMERGYEALSTLVKAKKNICCVLILAQQKHELANFTLKISKLCKINQIPYDYSSSIRPQDYKKFLLKYKPDAVFLVQWRSLIPNDCLQIPKKGIFVFHDALLPKYRGMATTTWPIINGERETGLSLIYAAKKMDAGDVIDQIKIVIGKYDTGWTLNQKYISLIPKMLLKNIDAILAGTNRRIPQDESNATYGCKRIPDDGKIDFGKSTEEIVRFIRALTFPYPGAFCYIKYKNYKMKKIIIWQAQEVKSPPVYVGRIPGRIISISELGSVDVLNRDGVIRIEKISLAAHPSRILSPSSILNSLAGTLV